MPHDQRGVDEQVRLAVAGDRAALESLLLHFHDALLRFIERALCRGGRGGAKPAPEDVLQETLIDAFRSIRTIEPRGSVAFFAWLKTIARTRHLNLLKARNTLKRGGVGRGAVEEEAATFILNLLVADSLTPSRVLRRKEVKAAMEMALAGLEPARRRAVELRYGSGLSIQQIAARTGKNAGAVKMLIFRGIRDLREAIGNGYSAGA